MCATFKNLYSNKQLCDTVLQGIMKKKGTITNNIVQRMGSVNFCYLQCHFHAILYIKISVMLYYVNKRF